MPAPPVRRGLPDGSPRRSRVRKAHTSAARASVHEALSSLGPDETSITEAQAEAVAEAVITAEDWIRSPDYVVAVLTDIDRRLVLFGPYRTFRAAMKAIEAGMPLAGRAGIYPLVTHPKRTR